MSLALIQESAKEARRLAIAGSTLAVGDFRLKKLAGPLEQAGAKVPVFAQVAKAISEVVGGTEAASAANLLGLSTLLNAVLYTQGQTGVEGQLEKLESFATPCGSTRTTSRVLKPLIEALTRTGSGRYQVIKAAVERGAFNDVRLIEPAIRALDDVYSEIADLVTERVLPIYGPGIAPLLKQKIDLKGKKGDARRLKALHRADPGATVELCKTALEEGSPEVRAAAVQCLAQHEDCMPLVLEQSNSKNKLVRAAALEALAAHDRPDVIKIFTDLIGSKTLDLLARPFRAMRSRQVVSAMLTEGQRVFEALLKGDEPSLGRFAEVLACLHGRNDPDTEQFLLARFGQCESLLRLSSPKQSAVSGPDLADKLADCLYLIQSRPALEALLSKRSILPATSFGKVFRAALKFWPAEKVYDEFAPLLGSKKVDAQSKAREIQVAIWSSANADDASLCTYYDIAPGISEAPFLKSVRWDPRWLDAAVKADDLGIVCSIARPGHPEVIKYLEGAMDIPKHRPHMRSVMSTLQRCEYGRLTDLFLEMVRKRTKTRGVSPYDVHVVMELARYLPPADLPKLDAFATTLDESYVDRFLEALGPLRDAQI